jgi:hypothetical protein
MLYAKPKLPGSTAPYVTSQSVGVTGLVDKRTPGECVLHVGMMDNLPAFGPCGSPGKVDTLLFKKLATPRAIRGPLPKSGYYECAANSTDCHWTSLADSSLIVEQPIPVSLNKLATTKHTAIFPYTATTPIRFTASRSPDSVRAGSGKFPHPIAITFWQWIGADSTRRASTCPFSPPPAVLYCDFKPLEAGRMIVKAYTGGWEQTNSVTVQCLVSDGDSALNDYGSDYRVRQELLDLLKKGNADSSVTAGWNASNPRGWRRETAMVIWRLANGGAFYTVPVDDPNATQCGMQIPPSMTDPNNPPVPGATLYATAHAHVDTANEEKFCKSPMLIDGRWVNVPEQPSEALDPTKERIFHVLDDSVSGASPSDWQTMLATGVPMFIISKNGFAYKIETLEVLPWTHEPKFRVYRAFDGKTSAPMTDEEKRCSWVPKYRG